jgi:hypothetical protein
MPKSDSLGLVASMFFLRCDFDAMIGKALTIARDNVRPLAPASPLLQQHLAFSQLRWSF